MSASPNLSRSWLQERDLKIKDIEAQEEKKMVVYQEQYKVKMVDQELDKGGGWMAYQVQGFLSSLNT